MRIGGYIYFSPSLLLEDLDINDKNLVIEKFKEQIEEYYFVPISMLIHHDQAFASGALLCLLVDALARYSSNNNLVGDRIRNLLENDLGFSTNEASRFYEEYRNGLLHESHIKNLGQFSFDNDFNNSVQIELGCLIVNPKKLFQEITQYFELFINKLKVDFTLYQIFSDRIKQDFEDEVRRLQP